MTQEDINEVMANSLKRWQLEHLVFDGGNIESARRLIRLLQAENAKLKAQLTWRPVSEKPENEERVDILYRYKGNKRLIPFVGEYSPIDGLWRNMLDNIEIVYWRPIGPIPPAPEGE